MARPLRPILTAILIDGPCQGQEIRIGALKPLIMTNQPGHDEPEFYEYISLDDDGISATYRHAPDA